MESVVEQYRRLLDWRWENFDPETFICNDPLSVVYMLKECLAGCDSYEKELEAGALLIAIISWGNRKMIRSNGVRLMEMMEWRPYSSLMNERFELIPDTMCIHRTLFGNALKKVCRNLREVYSEYGSLLPFVLMGKGTPGGYIEQLSKLTGPARLGSVSGKSACKRLCMFMRWMVRCEKPDLGLWREISAAELYAVLDVHVVRQARAYSLVSVTTAGWRGVEELTAKYREWCVEDPLRYDLVMMLNDLESETLVNCVIK